MKIEISTSQAQKIELQAEAEALKQLKEKLSFTQPEIMKWKWYNSLKNSNIKSLVNFKDSGDGRRLMVT